MEKYFDPKFPGSFAGLGRFKASLQPKLRAKADEWLREQDVYNLHQSVKRKFQRQQITTNGIDDQWQADLVDVTRISRENDGHRFLLTIIDCFSRYAWVKPLKSKEGRGVATALKEVFDSGRVPRRLNTDQGTEFKNKSVKKILDEFGVHHFTTANDDIKASIVERFNRTIMTKMYRFFTKNNTRRYRDVLEDLTSGYNDTPHSALGIAPAQVNLKNQERVWLRLHDKKTKRGTAAKFRVGDHVRISKSKKTFSKGYLPNWSTELFVVEKVNNTRPVTYHLTDLMSEKIAGKFYAQELIKAKTPEFYQIEKILDTKKTKRGGVRYLVKWVGYPSKFNQWVSSLKAV